MAGTQTEIDRQTGRVNKVQKDRLTETYRQTDGQSMRKER